MTIENVVIAGPVRTAIGDFGGALSSVPPVDLAAAVTREAMARAGVEPAEVGNVVFGNVIHTEPRDMYISRVAAMNAGIPETTPALTLNRLCGSGMQAIVSAVQMVMLGDASAAVAGGAESMSRAGYLMPQARWGARMGDATMTDMLTGTLTDPFGFGHMGVTAENIAAAQDISRQAQDELAAESHRRAAVAIAEGRFKDQILPIEVTQRRKTTVFDTDEHVRSDITAQGLSGLRPVFRKDGSVTAGNASSINDGAAALVVMNGAWADKRGLQPLARVVAYGHGGVAPEVMGLGPIPAVNQALQRAGLTIDDMSVIESNEAFAAQACAVANGLQFPSERTNPNGGAIALGHPVGASGTIITVKLIHELHRIQGRYGLATMCIGGGQGIALIVERL